MKKFPQGTETSQWQFQLKFFQFYSWAVKNVFITYSIPSFKEFGECEQNKEI